MELKDNLLLAHSQVIMSSTSPGSEPVIFGQDRETDKGSVGGASVNGNIIKRPRDGITKGITHVHNMSEFEPFVIQSLNRRASEAVSCVSFEQPEFLEISGINLEN